MGLHHRRSLAVLILIICSFWWSRVTAQSSPSSTRPARALDALLQDYAFRSFVHPRTGIPYNASLPSNLTGIEVTAMRLRTGSLRKKGVRMFKEFKIPMGVLEQPYAERLILVYQNLGNWSAVYYPLPGYVYLAPVLGLLAYDASNLSARNLPELDIRATNESISVVFSEARSVPDGSVARCVWIDLDGLVNFTNVISGNTCLTVRQGHFSIVVESAAPSPALPPGGPPEHGGGGKNNSRLWIIVGSVVGGFILLVLLGLLILWVRRYRRRNKMRQMEKAAEVGEALHVTTVGNTKAPVATVTRTQPTLENEYVP